MGVSSPSQKHSHRDPSKLRGQERGPSRDSRAASVRLASSRDSLAPWSCRRSWPHSGMCLPLSPGTPCPQLFPAYTLAPGDTASCSPGLIPSAQPRAALLLATSWPGAKGQAHAQVFPSLLQGHRSLHAPAAARAGEGGLVLPASGKGSSPPHLCSSCSLLWDSLPPAPLL